MKEEHGSIERLKALKSETLRLFRDAVVAQRKSLEAATGSHPTIWTKAAKNRDECFRILRKKLVEIAADI